MRARFHSAFSAVPETKGLLPSGTGAVWSARHARSAFTLIELILVMAILTMGAAITAPTLSHFFRGRALDSEARRLLSLIRSGQVRAVSEGVPMDLWVDADNSEYGLEAEPSYETSDPKGMICTLDSGLRIEVDQAVQTQTSLTTTMSHNRQASTISVPKVTHAHPGLPALRFLPNGTIAETSPRKLRLVGREDTSLWLVQTRDRLGYEISAKEEKDE